jgi:hypothetical protein
MPLLVSPEASSPENATIESVTNFTNGNPIEIGQVQYGFITFHELAAV